jgi:hypothetical protein
VIFNILARKGNTVESVSDWVTQIWFGYVDYFRCIKLSLVHDLAESIVGDIAPADGVDKDDKYKREKVSICYNICCKLKFNPS